MLKQCKEEYAEMVQSKDLKFEELNRVKDQQAASSLASCLHTIPASYHWIPSNTKTHI